MRDWARSVREKKKEKEKQREEAGSVKEKQREEVWFSGSRKHHACRQAAHYGRYRAWASRQWKPRHGGRGAV